MVERIPSADGNLEFVGQVESVELKAGEFGQQFYMKIKPEDETLIKGETGVFHEWIDISKVSSNDKVVEGSKLDLYLTKVEDIFPEAKKCKTVHEALNLLIGKKIRFKSEVLGKDYDGKKARTMIVPVELVE